MKTINLKYFLIILFFLVKFSTQIRLRREKKKTKKSSGHNIGTNLYSSQVTTKSMKRPLYWYFNVMLEKPSEKLAEMAEYNGLRYQTEQLEDQLDREFQNYIRDLDDGPLDIMEQKLLGATKAAARAGMDNISLPENLKTKKCGT